MLALEGKAGYYQGRIAQAIVDVVQSNGGLLSKEDLSLHRSKFDDPIKITYKGVDVWEMPPNGQGLTALLALNILSKLHVGGEWALYVCGGAVWGVCVGGGCVWM